MKELQQYIDRQNQFLRAAGKEEITMPLFYDHFLQLQEALQYDLSPENLCCDGELQGEVLRRKERFLATVQAQLDQA